MEEEKEIMDKNEIIVFSNVLFNEPHFKNESELLRLLTLHPFAKIQLDNNRQVAIQDIRAEFPNAVGLFYYEFIPDQPGRIEINIERTGDHFLLQNVATHPIFVKNEDHEEYKRKIDTFFSTRPSLSCLVIRSAMALATAILTTNRCCRILLEYDISNSTVKDILISSHKISGSLRVNRHGSFGSFSSLMFENTVIDERLISTAQSITSPDDPIYKRLVLFVAMALIQESTHCKSLTNTNDLDPEVDERIDPWGLPGSDLHFENLILGGALVLDINEPGHIQLNLKQDGQSPIVIGSPDVAAIQKSLCGGRAPVIRSTTNPRNVPEATEIPIIPVLLKVDTAEVTNEAGQVDSTRLYRFKLTVQNISDTTVYLPQEERLPNSAIRVTGYEYKSDERKYLVSPYGRCKFLTYDGCKKVAVPPGGWRTYLLDMPDYFINLDAAITYEFCFIFQCGFYNSVSSSQHRYKSNLETVFVVGNTSQDGPRTETNANRVMIASRQNPKTQFCVKMTETSVLYKENDNL